MLILDVILPRKLSLNQYHTLHFRTLHKIKQDFYAEVKVATRKGFLPAPPFDVQYHFTLHGGQMDVSNLVGMVKPIEDGMVREGIIEDDNHDIVKSITITEEKSQSKKKISYCRVTISNLYGA